MNRWENTIGLGILLLLMLAAFFSGFATGRQSMTVSPAATEASDNSPRRPMGWPNVSPDSVIWPTGNTASEAKARDDAYRDGYRLGQDQQRESDRINGFDAVTIQQHRFLLHELQNRVGVLEKDAKPTSPEPKRAVEDR